MSTEPERLDRSAVPTVLGPVAVHELGLTLSHEHLWTRNEGVYAQFPRLYDRRAVLAHVSDVVSRAFRQGVRTLCDATVMGLGRDVVFMQDVSRATGMHIIAATGLYTFDALPPYFAGRSVQDLAVAFVGDITEGVQGTSARAAFLKCATDEPGVTPGVEKVLRAVAHAHRETGAPILTHTSALHRRGLEQLTIFEEEGVDPSAVVIGHCGDTDDLGYLEELLAHGVTLGLDRFGQEDRLDPERRLNVVFELCERGYGDRLVISQDHSIVRDVFYDEDMLRARRNWHTSYVVDVVLNQLADRGLAATQVSALVGANVYRWLGSAARRHERTAS